MRTLIAKTASACAKEDFLFGWTTLVSQAKVRQAQIQNLLCGSVAKISCKKAEYYRNHEWQ